MINFFKKFSLLLFLPIVFSLFSPVNVNAQTSLTPRRSEICGGPCPVLDEDFNTDTNSIFNFIIFFARFLTFVGVALAVLFFVLAGLQYIIGQSENAKQNLITTFIGLIVIIIAYTVVSILVQLLESNSLGDLINSSK